MLGGTLFHVLRHITKIQFLNTKNAFRPKQEKLPQLFISEATSLFIKIRFRKKADFVCRKRGSGFSVGGTGSIKERPRLAQLLIRKLRSFIRLWRVILLRSDIRLTTSGIRYASFMANKISRKP